MRAHSDTTGYGGNGPQMAHSPPRGVGKNDSRYWRSKIFRRVDPRGIESAHYATRIQWRGRRHRFALGTANKEAAAAKAAAIWRDLTTHGLEMTLAKHKAQPQAQDTIVSVGEWLAATQRVFTRRPATFGDYARSLRLIVSEILAVAKGRARFGRGGASDYRHIIEGAPLAILSARAVREWQIRRVARAAGNPARERAAKISANSLVRQARSLFSPRLVKYLDPKLVPAELPFHGVEFFSRESTRYQSKLDPAELMQCAVRELAAEPLKVFLLALGAGLRRCEIDRLLWRQVDVARGAIRVEVTEAGALKTEDSAGAVQIDEELSALLRGFRARAKSEYVIEAGKGETASVPWGRRYRCRAVFAQLNDWLRSQGVTARRAIHELRKEAGSIVATQSGIHAASRFLRHADIAITAAHYADHKERITVPLGALLKPGNVADMPQATERRAAQ